MRAHFWGPLLREPHLWRSIVCEKPSMYYGPKRISDYYEPKRAHHQGSS